MTNLVQSIESMVEAGVKGIMGIAEGVLSPTSSTSSELPPIPDDHSGDIPPPQSTKPLTIPSSTTINPTSTQQGGGSKLNLPKQDHLIQTLDVPSGWIHLQSTYLDGDIGQKKVRSFGLKNMIDGEVELEVESDLQGQLVFWLGEDEKSTSSSASSTSSSSTSAGSPSLHLTLPSSTTITIFFAFQPTQSLPSTPAVETIPTPNDDGGYTPRVKPALSRTHSSEMSPVGVGSPSERSSEFSSISGSSVAGSVTGSYSIQSSRRPEPIHRSFSVHGSITIRAITSFIPSLESAPVIPPAPPTVAHQIINLPFFATVCRSLFTAAPIDPIQGLVIGSQISSGELVIDFGNNSVVGGRYHRDILLVNRSEIELNWKTTVVSSPYKEAVWFELRDLDSENVFGINVDNHSSSSSSQPLPLPSLSSRHLRLELRVKKNLILSKEFEFKFLIENINQSGNIITCKAIGNIKPEKSSSPEDSLIVLSGNDLDFGKVLDGTWSKKLITCKNNSDKSIDVKFSVTKGFDTVFKLAGVAGEDLDEDLPIIDNRPRINSMINSNSKKINSELGSGLSRTSTKDSNNLRGRDLIQQQQYQQHHSSQQQQNGLRDPRAESPISNGTGQSKKSRPTSSIYSSEMMINASSVPGDFGSGRLWSNLPNSIDVDSNSISGFSDVSNNGKDATQHRDHSQPPSRPLSRVTSRNSSYLLHTGGDEDGDEFEDDEEGDFEPPFFGGGGGSDSNHYHTHSNTNSSQMRSSTLSESNNMLTLTNDQIIPNQIEELTMRPGTEYRIYVLHRPEIDTKNPPEIAGKLRKSNFKVFLDTVQTQHSRSTSSNSTSNGLKDITMSSSSSTTSSTSTSTSNPNIPNNTRRIIINCTIEHCTSIITLPQGKILDFGKVTVGASKSKIIKIQNLSELVSKVEIKAISKVISSNKNVIIIPPFETVDEKLEFFPRRINEKYEKECFVRNLGNRGNDQVIEIRSQNVDVYNLTLHSHLYRILTPSGSNFLDFGNVVVNAPTVRTVHVENLSNTELILDLYASQPEDINLYVKAEDEPILPGKSKNLLGKYSENDTALERMISPANGDLKERFMETLQELSEKNANGSNLKSKSKVREKTAGKAKKEETEKDGKSVGQQVAVALKKGGRGRPVQLYGNSVVFKDRTLLEPHEYLDLACGPPVCAHRSPRAKRFTLLDTIELEDKTKLSGRHDKIPKLDFAAVAKASGLVGKEAKAKKKHPHQLQHAPAQSHNTSEVPSTAQSPGQSGNTSTLTSPKAKAITVPATVNPSPASMTNTSQKPDMHLNLATLASQVMQRIIPESDGRKSPALTAKRPIDLKMTEAAATSAPSDPSRMTVDELLLAIERHDSLRSTITHSTLEEEEIFVKKSISLKKELNNIISNGKLKPIRTINVESLKTKGIIVVMTPNGSIRPHIGIRTKRSDSRIFIKLIKFDKSLLNEAGRGNCQMIKNDKGEIDDKLIEKITSELPIRDLIIRSSCVKSVLEVQQTSINFGGCDKGEVREKTIVIHNKSDTIGLFRLRTSGSIASGDLKLGLGRYGVISAFGRKEVANFSFTPSLVGNYQETITVENVLDSYNDQSLAVKAVVRKVPAFKVEPSNLDFGIVQSSSIGSGSGTTVYNSTEKPNKKGKGKEEGNDYSSSKSQSFILTNVSKHEKTFVITVSSGISPNSFARLHLVKSENEVGTALSKVEEEEVEGILQKLKIAKRKKKADKIEKYKKRLTELGIDSKVFETTDNDEEENGNEDKDPEKKKQTAKEESTIETQSNNTVETPQTEFEPEFPSVQSSPKKETQSIASTTESIPASSTETNESTPSASPSTTQTCTTSLSLNLAPNQKMKILVELVPQADNTVGNTTGGGNHLSHDNDINANDRDIAQDDINATITVHDKRNTDETVSISVTAIKGTPENTQKETLEKAVKMADRAKNTTTDSLALALMQHSLDLTLNCEVSPTAFCVGSTLFLPSTSTHYSTLSSTGKFSLFPSDAESSSSKGLILGDGWSRQIPGNTHAEANALTNFRSKYGELKASFGGWGSSSTTTATTTPKEDTNTNQDVNQDVQEKNTLPSIEEVLKDADCYATMEPCSVRTSGGPSCALELVRAGVKAVYLGVEEPPDFVQCEGVRILEDGGVKVIRTSGLEEACLKAARRGRN